MNLRIYTLNALLIVSALCVLPSANSQTLTINGGTPCNYTQYTKTVNAGGAPNFSFTASGCSTGGGSTPALGTAQFTASTFNSVLQGTPRDVSVQRDGHVPGVANSLSGSVVVDTGSAGNCSIASPNFTFSDGETGTKTITVTATNAGACNLSLNMLTGSASGRTTAGFTVTPSNAIAFAAGTTTTTPSQNWPLTVNRTDGNTSQITVDFLCTLTGFSVNNNQSGQITFPANTPNNSQPVTVAIPSLSGAGNGIITCTLSNAVPNGTIVNSPSRNAPEHVVTVTPPVAPTCAPTAAPTQFTAGTAQNVVLNSACTANTNAGTVYTWSRAPSNTTGPNVTSTSGAQSGANFLASATAGGYAYRLVACNGAVCTGNLDVTVTVNPPVDANCLVFDAPDLTGGINSREVRIAKDRTSAMRIPKNQLRNFTWNVLETYAVMQVSDQPCAPTMADPASLPLDAESFRSTCQFSIYTTGLNIVLNGSKCTLPTVADGGYYYINLRPSQANAQGSALTLTTPTSAAICNLYTLPSGAAACQYYAGF